MCSPNETATIAPCLAPSTSDCPPDSTTTIAVETEYLLTPRQKKKCTKDQERNKIDNTAGVGTSLPGRSLKVADSRFEVSVLVFMCSPNETVTIAPCLAPSTSDCRPDSTTTIAVDTRVPPYPKPTQQTKEAHKRPRTKQKYTKWLELVSNYQVGFKNRCGSRQIRLLRVLCGWFFQKTPGKTTQGHRNNKKVGRRTMLPFKTRHTESGAFRLLRIIYFPLTPEAEKSPLVSYTPRQRHGPSYTTKAIAKECPSLVVLEQYPLTSRPCC